MIDNKQLTFEEFKAMVLEDYRIVNESREASLMGRKEVLTGKAKFGIFGDGKEVAQVAMAKTFKNGDFRSGYYRDQTFMMAAGLLTLEEFFAQLYAHTDIKADPASGGRSMNCHFATRSLDEQGMWKNLTSTKNSAADSSPTASQMPRLLGLANASKYFRQLNLTQYPQFSNQGNEVAFGTIGDASTSEGLFFETINAAGVLQVPIAMSVWDDGYGISVEKKYQTTKGSISEVLSGFQQNEKGKGGWLIFKEKAWNYPGLITMYEKGVAICRTEHTPVLFHIEDVTQPQGHSTSGSHERYKSKERLAWEAEFDCIKKMKEWILANNIATKEELENIEKQAKITVKTARDKAWNNFNQPIKEAAKELSTILTNLNTNIQNPQIIENITFLNNTKDILWRDVVSIARKTLYQIASNNNVDKTPLLNFIKQQQKNNEDKFNSHLYSQSKLSPINIKAVEPIYTDDTYVDGREILRDNYDYLLANNPLVSIFGQDVGKIGGVNQTCEGLQAKYGEIRVSDAGIREATIVGQGIGMAQRGLRPIAEIQYLDYLLYALEIMSDDLATLHYRTKGGQKAPLIVSTRGHRLEGIWHSGSPMGMIIHALRGMHVCVPRNMTKAAGFYNTLLEGDDPALVIEPLNGYRLKERKPSNWGQFKTPLGIPETLIEGKDVTLVTYGSCCRIAEEAVKLLVKFNISVELIDVQTLLPFDIEHRILASLKKTNKIAFLDEDVPGGATAFMMQEVLEKQNGYQYLDAKPITITSKAHRPAYGSDGDYFSKPNVEDVFEAIYNLMSEYNPNKYPKAN